MVDRLGRQRRIPECVVGADRQDRALHVVVGRIATCRLPVQTMNVRFAPAGDAQSEHSTVRQPRRAGIQESRDGSIRHDARAVEPSPAVSKRSRRSIDGNETIGATCNGEARVVDLEPGRFYSYRVEAYSSDEAEPRWATNCRAYTVLGVVVAASCGALEEIN